MAILNTEAENEQKKERRIEKIGGIEQYEMNEIRSTSTRLRQTV